jgi:DNA-binding MarR family transcriptional regulator
MSCNLKRLTQYDEETGEVLVSVSKEELQLLVLLKEYYDITPDTNPEELIKRLDWKERNKRNKILRERYEDRIMVFQRMLKKAAKELNNREYRIFGYLLGIMEFENWINIPQREIAKELHIHYTDVSKAIKGLREKGYIEVIKKGRENYYRINPEIAWKGNLKEHIQILRKNDPVLNDMFKRI